MKVISFVTSVTLLLAATSLYAEDSHMHDHHDMGSHKNMDEKNDAKMDHESHGSDMQGMFLVKKKIDGYDVSFHVMDARKGMRHGGNQNFMVKVEQNGKMLKDISVNSKVVGPDNSAESKMLMRMGGWYMNGYDLDQKGQYQLMVLFKTADGKKHKGGVYYPVK